MKIPSIPRQERIFASMFVLSLFVLSTSCSTPIQSSIPEGVVAPPQSNLETIVILGTNDIHGALLPQLTKTKEAEGQAPLSYQKGGLSILASHIGILKKEFGEHFIMLDAGDEFQGTLESNSEEGAPMVDFFNLMQIQGAAIGNHEFDFGPIGPKSAPSEATDDPFGALKARMQQAHYPYLAANIIDKKTGKFPDFPNTLPHRLIEIGKLKIGIIGLSTLETPTSTRHENVKDLKFTHLGEATTREAALLREKGAHIVLVVAHVGLDCGIDKASNNSRFRKPTDPQGECGASDELVRFLNEIPAGTVDAVVSGHSHKIIHHWITGVPVIQAGTRSHFFNLIYLTYDWNQNKILKERTRIEGPVPVCPKFFENQKDCDGDKAPPQGGRGNLVDPTFHGHLVKANQEVEQTFKEVVAKTESIKKRIIGRTERMIEHSRTGESEMGNLATDAIRQKLKADFAVLNGGGIRASIESGDITYEAAYRTFPFDNSLSLLTLTGKEFKLLLRIAQSGARGFFPVSGVKIYLKNLDMPVSSDDLNHDGKIEPWEINRISKVVTETNAQISDKKMYKVALIDFMVTGGDDLGWFMSQIPKDRIQLTAGGTIRDVVVEYIQNNSPLQSLQKPLKDPAHPRFIFLK